VRELAFSGDGRHLAAAGDDGQVWAWQIDDHGIVAGSGRAVARHHGRVAALAFAGGALLVTVGVDRAARAVDLAAGTTWEVRLRTVAPAGLIARAGEVDIVDAAGWLERWQPGGSIRRLPIPGGATTGAALPGGGTILGYADGRVHLHPAGEHTPAALRRRLAGETTTRLGPDGRPTAPWIWRRRSPSPRLD